jgi:anti-sigma regulatory factor (Ser/Thr protein kinase)
MLSRLTLSNRQENLGVLVDFVRDWGKEQGLPVVRRNNLEQAASGIFQHLVTHAYSPDQPGSIIITLDDKGPRLRLIFEDDAPPHNPTGFNATPDTPSSLPPNPNLISVRHLADSLIYYRTADRKNRLVVFLTM